MLPSSAIYKHQRWGSAWGTQLDRTLHHNSGHDRKRQTSEILLKKFYLINTIHIFDSLQKLHIDINWVLKLSDSSDPDFHSHHWNMLWITLANNMYLIWQLCALFLFIQKTLLQHCHLSPTTMNGITHIWNYDIWYVSFLSKLKSLPHFGIFSSKFLVFSRNIWPTLCCCHLHW